MSDMLQLVVEIRNSAWHYRYVAH